MDVPHLETHPWLDTALYRASLIKNKKIESSERFSINAHPRLEDVNLAYRDLVLYRRWSRVALLYTGLRDGDGSGAATFHLQHLLLHHEVDCLTRRLPSKYRVIHYSNNFYDDAIESIQTLLKASKMKLKVSKLQ